MGYKNIVVAFFLFGLSFQGVAQGIPIQLMVVDSDGFEMPNKQVKLRLTLRNDTSLTTGQYQEVHLTQSNDFGIVSESLGGGIVTTNSSAYDLGEFAFNTTEPMITIELDTTALSNQYYTVGTLAYTYPLVSRRALRSDSADYSSLSRDAEYADTAEYARNFDESIDNDTSVTNEIQSLSFSNDTLSISQSNDIVIPLSSFQNYSLKCVAMGASDSCSAWGVSPASLIPTDNYTYTFQGGLYGDNGNLYHPHWRKFQVEGLSLSVNDKLIIKESSVANTWNLYSTNNIYTYYYKPLFVVLTPIIENGNVYFYIYKYSSLQCISDGTNSDLTQGCWAVGTGFDSDCEILIEGRGNLKHTGIYFSIEDN